jgi:hypothetical protein
MISALQNGNSGIQTASPARVSAPPSSGAEPAASQSVPELTQQVMEVIETQGDTAEAMLQAQVSIFKEALDIRQDMAGSVLQMLDAVQAFQAGAAPAASSGGTLNIKA